LKAEVWRTPSRCTDLKSQVRAAILPRDAAKQAAETAKRNAWSASSRGLDGCFGGERTVNVRILVTGSSGLIGSEAVQHFDLQGHEVFGVDNNMRRVFFGPAGDTIWNLERLKSATKRFTHTALDIRDRAAIEELFRTRRFDLIVHCAAQPSH